MENASSSTSSLVNTHIKKMPPTVCDSNRNGEVNLGKTLEATRDYGYHGKCALNSDCEDKGCWNLGFQGSESCHSGIAQRLEGTTDAESGSGKVEKEEDDDPNNNSAWDIIFGREDNGANDGSDAACGGKVYQVFSKLIVYGLSIFGVWALIYIILGEGEALSGGSAMTLLVLEVLAIVLGRTFEVVNAPPMLGMLAAGLMLNNLNFGRVQFNFSPPVFKPLRAISVVILLTRGALSVNPTLIRKHWKIVPLLAFAPCLFEAIAAGLAIHLVIEFPVHQSALIGSVMSAMSSVLVVQYLGIIEPDLADKNKHVFEITRAACGLDVVLAIALTKTASGFAFNQGDAQIGLISGVVQVLVGNGFGIFWGLLLGAFVTKRNSVVFRTFALSTGGILSMLGLGTIGHPRGGPLGVFVGALITVTMWRRKKIGGENNNDIQKSFNLIWVFFQPLLFAIIGARIDLNAIDWTVLSGALICLSIGYIVRLTTVIAATSFVGLEWSQRLFLVIAWIPKGTLQAALGPVPLDLAIDTGAGPEMEAFGYQVMHISTLMVIVGSSLSSICFLTIGKYLAKNR